MAERSEVRYLQGRDLLRGSTAHASAPGRVDCGGTWDLVHLALPFAAHGPSTVNIALSLRTTVSISEYDHDRVLIHGPGLQAQNWALRDAPYSAPYGAFVILAQFFNTAGVEISISSDIPPRSGLGGSAAAITAAAVAFDSMHTGSPRLPPNGLAELAHQAESVLYTCGRQDHLAAAYGGVNLWQWRFGQPDSVYKRFQISGRDDMDSIGRRLVVVFSGEPHNAAAMTEGWVRSFQDGHNRQLWLDANRETRRFWSAVCNRDWRESIDALNEESRIRAVVSPDAWTDRATKFAEVARARGCAARFAGGGGGGCIWALGEPSAAEFVRTEWASTAASSAGAALINATVEPRGLLHWMT